MAKVTYYLEVSSSWCYWAEPAWSELKHRYEGKVEFGWKIAQMPPEGYPVSKSQCEWFYRRSGSIMRSPFMLNSGWWEPDIKQYDVPNLLAEAGRDFGVNDDRIRLALAHAGMRDGKKIGRWEVAAPIAAQAAGLDSAKFLARAQSPEVAARAKASTDEFFAMQVNQRPTFLITNNIGDRVVISGLARVNALATALDEILADEAAYASWKAHFGDVPAR
jgi:predicted DsbA family dithiol-disulfide isomerase